MERVTLPNDQWADVRRVEDVTMRGRGLLQRCASAMGGPLTRSFELMRLQVEMVAAAERGDDAEAERVALLVTEAPISDSDIEILDRFQVASVVAFVNRWSYPDPPTMENVQDLTVAEYDALQAVTGALAMQLVNGAVKVSPDDHDDPASPTVPSNV